MRKLYITFAILAVMGFFAMSAKPAQAAGISWMCRSWRSGAYTITHCTKYWHWSHGQQVSDNPSWVPNSFHSGNLAVIKPRSVAPTVTYSGHSPNHYPVGQCTYGAAALAHDDVDYLGNASQWFYNARARGLPVGYSPRVGSTVVFVPGYHVSNFGTSAGHVAHVDAVSGNHIEITEMNNSYYGGFDRYDTIWVQVVPGASFIY
jgi:surface antigen